MNFNAIAAISNNKGIGLNNTLPWKLKSDLIRFQKLTIGNKNNCIIMGKNTWDSVNFLKNRHNYILSSTLKIDEKKNNYEIKSFSNINLLINYLKLKKYDVNWIIGGTKVYQTFFNNNLVDNIYITLIDRHFECDAFFPSIPKYFIKKELILNTELFENKYSIYYIIYQKIKKNQELIYKNIHKCIVKEIHFDDYPNIYFTINYENKEIQTTSENLKLNNNKI